MRPGWASPASPTIPTPSASSRSAKHSLRCSSETLARDAGVPADGAGFESFTLAWTVDSSFAVLDALDKAVAAGGTLVKHGQRVFWGGFSGYFADPDGHLWEVACGSADYAAESSSADPGAEQAHQPDAPQASSRLSRSGAQLVRPTLDVSLR
jgi:Glyoxalase/Bleomycin resistance protein/Dioxygenase superfamily